VNIVKAQKQQLVPVLFELSHFFCNSGSFFLLEGSADTNATPTKDSTMNRGQHQNEKATGTRERQGSLAKIEAIAMRITENCRRYLLRHEIGNRPPVHRKGRNSLWGTTGWEAYEVRPHENGDGVDLISDRFRDRPIWYAGPDAVRYAIAYAKYRSHFRSQRAIIRVLDDFGAVIQTH
jgi:hypothetical protein